MVAAIARLRQRTFLPDVPSAEFAAVLFGNPARGRGQPLVGMHSAEQLYAERRRVDAEQRQIDGRYAENG